MLRVADPFTSKSTTEIYSISSAVVLFIRFIYDVIVLIYYDNRKYLSKLHNWKWC